MIIHYFKFLQYIFIFDLIFEVLSSGIPRPRGVPLSKASLYQANKNFTCLDTSQTIPFSRVNDDYCDCLDASDEPGTSACPYGVFHCANIGHKPEYIPSNRVNDGICDCCDGTDEYSSDKCENNCNELGKTAREEAQQHLELIKAGKQIRAEYIQKGAQLKKEKTAKITELSNIKEDAEKIRNEKEIQKKAAEDLERVALESYRQLEEERKKRNAEEEEKNNRVEATETFNRFDSNQDGLLDISELQTRKMFDKDGDGLVSEDDAKFFLDNKESVDLETFINNCWSTVKSFMKLNMGDYKPPNMVPDNNDTELDLEEQEEQEEENQQDEDEAEQSESEAEENKIDSTVTYDEETQKLIETANTMRNEFQDAEQRIRDIENEIKDIEKYLEKDFGPEDEYSVLEGQTFEYHDNEYIYKLQPFEKTSQHPKSSSSEALLGVWGKWSGPESNKYEQMTFEQGQTCWNGPQRSTIVEIGCGRENKIVSVTEPNRCEYLFEFITPAACREVFVDIQEDLHDEL